MRVWVVPSSIEGLKHRAGTAGEKLFEEIFVGVLHLKEICVNLQSQSIADVVKW